MVVEPRERELRGLQRPRVVREQRDALLQVGRGERVRVGCRAGEALLGAVRDVLVLHRVEALDVVAELLDVLARLVGRVADGVGGLVDRLLRLLRGLLHRLGGGGALRRLGVLGGVLGSRLGRLLVRSVEEVLERVADTQRVEGVLRLRGLGGGRGGGLVLGGLPGRVVLGGARTRGGLRRCGRAALVVLARVVLARVVLARVVGRRGARGRLRLGFLRLGRLVRPGHAGPRREGYVRVVVGHRQLGGEPHAHEDGRRHRGERERLLARRHVQLRQERLPGRRVAGPSSLRKFLRPEAVRLPVVTPHDASHRRPPPSPP